MTAQARDALGAASPVMTLRVSVASFVGTKLPKRRLLQVDGAGGGDLWAAAAAQQDALLAGGNLAALNLAAATLALEAGVQVDTPPAFLPPLRAETPPCSPLLSRGDLS